MRWFVLTLLSIAAQTAGAFAAPDAEVCGQAARIVSAEEGVPYEALEGLITVTPRSGDAPPAPIWPWSVSRDGAGAWFDTRDEALAFAYRTFKRHGLDFDLGCFQINFAAHGAQFASIDEVFDPLANARYAARYLKLLHEEFGDWDAAGTAFRIRDRAAVSKHLPRIVGFRTGPPASSGSQRAAGSLVPLDAPSRARPTAGEP